MSELHDSTDERLERLRQATAFVRARPDFGARVAAAVDREAAPIDWVADLSPQPEDAVMRGNQLNAFPEQFPRRVRHGKISVGFAVEPGVLADDLKANRAGDLSVGGFNHLKLGQPAFQFVRRQVH